MSRSGITIVIPVDMNNVLPTVVVKPIDQTADTSCVIEVYVSDKNMLNGLNRVHLQRDLVHGPGTCIQNQEFVIGDHRSTEMNPVFFDPWRTGSH